MENDARKIREKVDRPIAMGTLELFEALEKTNIYCFRYYPKLKLIVVPERTCKAWGCKPYYENMPYSLCEEVVDDAYKGLFNELYNSIDEGAPSASQVFALKDKKTWSRVTITTTVWDDENRPEECVAIVENLSTTKNLENEIVGRNKELSLAMQAFQIAAETTDTIVFLFDTKRHSILVTDHTANQWGIMTEQMGVPYDTAASGIVAEGSKAEYIRLHEEMMNGAVNTSGRVQLCDADGNVGYYRLTFRALLDEEGKPNGKAVGVYKNITQDIQHDQRQSFIIESLANTYSSVYCINIATLKYERIMERQISSLKYPNYGNWYSTFTGYVENQVGEESRKDMYDAFYDIRHYEENLGDNESISVEFQRMDKGWRKAFMFPAERDENGKMISVIFAVQKIDTQKQKELETQKALQIAYNAAQLASQAKTTFLSNISHDIRTPMNAIIGMTAIAASNIDNRDKVADCLKKITSSSKHLLGLINEVLDMSKIESGRVDLSEEEFSISDLIDELITINQPLATGKGHKLSVTITNIIHEKVIGDSIRLQQVLTNLLTNAIKYTPDGGRIRVSISEKQTNKSNIGWYEVVVKDNGIGMTDEFRQTMFEPFSRAKDERIATIQGTGLGMPIARNIIRMMNGDITVESKINEGSTFTVSFALRLQREENDHLDSFADLPVLVVDDDIIACESTCAVLNGLSMKSEYVTSGALAVEKTVERHERNDDYFALIVDWKMPGMDGVATTRAIRQRIGDDIPIVVLTSYDWADIEPVAREAGVNAFLRKPLFKSKVVDMFSDLCGDKSGTDVSNLGDELQSYDFSGKKVLLAEDNLLNKEIAVELLSMTGLEIETAENGKICLDMFMSAPSGTYDLIFMDIQMPVMNGYETTTAIRASDHPDSTSIPIIAMTANAFTTDVRAAFDAGMNGHISKPIDMTMVMKVLEEYLGKKGDKNEH